MGNRVLKITKERTGSVIKTQEYWTYTYYVRDAQGNVMATYERKFTTIGGTSAKDELKLDESHLYGSSRLGVEKRAVDNVLANVTYTWAGTYNGSQEIILGSQTATTNMAVQNTATPVRKLGKKVYELVNHLGNVLVTVADRKLAVEIPTTTVVDYYLPDVVSATDYAAFGSSLPRRSFSGTNYKYGFNGKENDSETGTQDYGFRIYNPSLGKFLSVDPLIKDYPELTPYQFASNTPIRAVDLDGLEAYFTEDGSYIGSIGGSTVVRVVSATDVKTYSSDVTKLHSAASGSTIKYQTLKKRDTEVVANPFDVTVFARIVVEKDMTIDDLMMQANVIYGENPTGKDATSMSHLLINREIKNGKWFMDAKERELSGWNYLDDKNILPMVEKYGLFNFVMFGLHKPNDARAVEQHKKVLMDGANQVDGGTTNSNYKNFFDKKSNVKDLYSSIGVAKPIVSEIIKARLGTTTDPNPNKDGWRGNGKTNIPQTDIPGYKSD